MSTRLEILNQQLAAARLENERRPWERALAAHAFEHGNHPGPGGLLIPLDGNTQQVSEMLMREGYNKTPETTENEPIADDKPAAAPRWTEAGEFFVWLAPSNARWTQGRVYPVMRRIDGHIGIRNNTGKRHVMSPEHWANKRSAMFQHDRLRMCDKDGWIEHTPVEDAVCPVPAGIKFEVRLREGKVIEGAAVMTWAKTTYYFDCEIVAWRLVV